jgi:dipeptidyl aminopeptidase/acylaminoacyl peptidase
VGDHKARPLIESAFNKAEAQVSPDGRWLAYASNESGRQEVYVQPFPSLGGKWQVSTTGGAEPRWSRDGRQLVYSNGNKMMSVEVETKSGFAAGSPRLLFDQPYAHGGPGSYYDMAPDGQHFVMLKVDETKSTQFELRVVLNWGEEVTRRLGAVTK